MIQHPLRRLVLCIALALPVAGWTAPPSAQELANRVLVNGRVLTVDDGDRVAEAVAIRDQRILAVGTTAEIDKLAGPRSERIDLAGRTVTPGLIDTHLHFSQGGLMRLTTIDLSFPGVERIADVVRLVASRNAELAERGAADAWIVGRGWDEGKLAERRYLHAADIDPVSGDRPAWLAHTMGHYGVANSLALTLAGIDRDTPDPAGGTIDRDAAGNPTGVLKEAAMRLVTKHIPAADAADKREALRQMARELNRECMTGAKDPGIGWGLGSNVEAAEETWQAYQEVAAEGALTVRLFALWPSPRTLEEAKALARRILPFTRPYESTGGDRLISGGVKVFADGSGGARTAWVWDEWNENRTEVDEGNRGYPAFDADVMRQIILMYHVNGIHMGVHAIGDRAIDWVVASYALALMSEPTHGLRHSIIHANIPSDLAMNTMAELQRRFDTAYPEPQPTFTWWIGDTYAGNFGAARSHRLNPFNTYQRKGIQWAGGSDYFVTPFPARYGIWAAIAREPLLGVHGKDAFGDAESIDVKTALRAYTAWAAHQMFLEEKTGTIEPGKYADLAVWDTDFYTAPTGAIKDAQCLMTLLDGEIVHRAADFPAVP